MHFISFLILTITALLVSSCDDTSNKIAVYDIPKEHNTATVKAPPPEASPPMSTRSIIDPKWNVPTDWREEEPGMMRKARWTVSGPNNKQAEVTVASFPGDVGGELANVNRWRNQIGLPSISQQELDNDKQTIQVNSLNAVYFNIKNPNSSKSTLAAMIKVEDHSYFFKMMGDASTVEKKEEEFLKFMLTVDFE